MPKSKQSPNARFLFQFRVRDDELAAFRAAAEKANTNPSEWARTILRREAGLWTGQRRTDMAIGMTTKTIETLARECADEAWGVLLQGAAVSRVDDEVVSDNGTETRPVTAWEPMGGDWDTLDDLLGHKAEQDERAAFEHAYMSRLREHMSRVC